MGRQSSTWTLLDSLNFRLGSRLLFFFRFGDVKHASQQIVKRTKDSLCGVLLGLSSVRLSWEQEWTELSGNLLQGQPNCLACESSLNSAERMIQVISCWGHLS